MPLGEIVVEKRMQRDISQKELARLAGMPASKLCRIEKGYVDDPGAFALKKIARVLEMSVDELLEKADDEDESRQLQAA